MARLLQSQHKAALRTPLRAVGVGRHEGLALAPHGPARLALLAVVLVFWGHDIGTAAGDLLAPRPETFQQLVANMAQPKTGQQARAVAEPYFVVGSPHVVQVARGSQAREGSSTSTAAA